MPAEIDKDTGSHRDKPVINMTVWFSACRQGWRGHQNSQTAPHATSKQHTGPPASSTRQYSRRHHKQHRACLCGCWVVSNFPSRKSVFERETNFMQKKKRGGQGTHSATPKDTRSTTHSSAQQHKPRHHGKAPTPQRAQRRVTQRSTARKRHNALPQGTAPKGTPHDAALLNSAE